MPKTIMVIGAGVVGLACARGLSMAGFDVLVTEQHAQIGTEVSGRNSGVIHAGIYYPTGSEKAKYCVRGRSLLYEYCAHRNVPFQRTQKLIVATTPEQDAILTRIQAKAWENGVQLDHISGGEAIEIEPKLFATSALVSPLTGIVDVHALMFSFLAEAEGNNATLALQTRINAVSQDVHGCVVTGTSQGEAFEYPADFVVNAAGLGATDLANSYWPDHPQPPHRFAKGNYFAITGALPFHRLIYPVPEQHGLGIHYTLDLSGKSRLGPNVRWVDQLDYSVDQDVEPMFRQAVRSYWPGVDDRKLTPDYVGYRPKIAQGDFSIHRTGRVISLLGIESPGLTSSLAIAEQVVALATQS